MKKCLFRLIVSLSLISAFTGNAEVQIGCKALMALVAEQISQAQTQGHEQADRISGYTEGLYETMNSLDAAISDLPSSVPSETITYLRQLKDDLWYYTQQVGSYSIEIQETLGLIDEQLVLLNEADCDCGSAEIDPDGPSSDCGCCCADELHEIRDKVIELDNACDEYFEKGKDYFEKSLQFYGLATNFINKLEKRLWIPDDGLYQDLKNLSETFKGDYADLLSTTNIKSLYTHTLFTDVGYPFTNEGIVGLFGLATQMNDALLQIDQVNTLHYIASNIVNALDYTPQLNFISNYLDKTQRRLFEAFNVNFRQNEINNFKGQSQYGIMTNFWNNPRSSYWITYVNGNLANKTGLTNWFTRVEYALYGLAGMFNNKLVNNDLKAMSGGTSSTGENKFEEKVESMTNSVKMAAIGNATNSLVRLVNSYHGFFSSLKFNSGTSGGSTTLVIVPEMNICNQTTSPIVLNVSEYSHYFTAVKNISKVCWILLFAFVMYLIAKALIHFIVLSWTFIYNNYVKFMLGGK